MSIEFTAMRCWNCLLHGVYNLGISFVEKAYHLSISLPYIIIYLICFIEHLKRTRKVCSKKKCKDINLQQSSLSLIHPLISFIPACHIYNVGMVNPNTFSTICIFDHIKFCKNSCHCCCFFFINVDQ